MNIEFNVRILNAYADEHKVLWHKYFTTPDFTERHFCYERANKIAKDALELVTIFEDADLEDKIPAYWVEYWLG